MNKKTVKKIAHKIGLITAQKVLKGLHDRIPRHSNFISHPIKTISFQDLPELKIFHYGVP